MHLDRQHSQIALLLKKIPKGKVTTYKILSAKIKVHPRVVGRLLAKNPRPIKIPCHRVVYSNGRIGGYIFGKNKKIALLRKEGVEVRNGKIYLKKYLFSYGK